MLDLEYLNIYNLYNTYELSSNLIQPYLFNKLDINKKQEYLKDMRELWYKLTEGMHSKIRIANVPYIKDVWGF